MTRINFEVDADQVKSIDELVDQTGLKTKVNLFNTALTLFEWAVRERLAGRAICSQDVKTGILKEIEMPGFPQIKTPVVRKLASGSEGVARPARAKFATARAAAVRNNAKERGDDERLAQLVNRLSLYAETPQQAKEVVDVVKAFGAEIKPEAQEKLRAMINPK